MSLKKQYVLVVFLVLNLPVPGWCKGIEWQPYDQAFEMAKHEKKKIFIHFKSNRCRYCDDMERETFSDEQVIEFLNEHFVSVRVSAEKQWPLIEKYKVPGYPDNRFFDMDNNNEVFQFFGFQEPAVFMVFLRYVHTESYTNMTVLQFYKSEKNIK